MSAQPDIQGFRAAMNRGRQFLGQDVTFHVPVDPVWPPGTAINPETGRPYDPTVVPASGGDATDITIHVGVVSPVLTVGAKDEVTDDMRGVVRTNRAALDVALADVPNVSDAVAFTLNTVRYRVTDTILDGLTGADRYLVFGEAT